MTAWLFLALSPVVPAWRQLPSGTPGCPCRPRRPRPTPTGPDRGAEGVLCRPRLTPLVSARRSRAGDTGVQGWGLPEAAEGAGARAAGESAFVPGPPARPPKHARLSEIAAELGDRPLGPAPLTSPLHRPQCGRQACRSGFPVLRADRPPSTVPSRGVWSPSCRIITVVATTLRRTRLWRPPRKSPRMPPSSTTKQ